MVRPFGIKVCKRKERTERYDKEEDKQTKKKSKRERTIEMVRPFGIKVCKRKERTERYDKGEDKQTKSEQKTKEKSKRERTTEMVRPFGIKVNKRKERTEGYDKEEDKQTKSEQKKSKRERTSKTEENVITEEAASGEDIVGGIRIVLSDHCTEKPGVIFVLEKASLEVGKVSKAGRTVDLLSSSKHATFLKKNNRNPADYRPDITHQALMMILDSPLNKAGRLKAVYVRTEENKKDNHKGVLFEVDPCVRLPREYDRFAGLMLQLLQNMSITANINGKGKKVLNIIKNTAKDHLPVNSRIIGFSHSSKKLVNIQKHLANACDETPERDTVFVLGAMAHGKIECDYIDDFVSISGYPLSAAWCVSRICEAVQTNWNII